MVDIAVLLGNLPAQAEKTTKNVIWDSQHRTRYLRSLCLHHPVQFFSFKLLQLYIFLVQKRLMKSDRGMSKCSCVI